MDGGYEPQHIFGNITICRRGTAGGACYKDELIRQSGLSAQSAMAALTMLLLKGYVREENGRYRLLVRFQ